MPASRAVSIADILQDSETFQVRAEIDPKTVEQYARSMKAGAKFPPVTLHEVDGRLILVDGFHRVAAAEAVGEAMRQMQPSVEATVVPSSMGAAMKAAALANTAHGKQLKRSEYRRAFGVLATSGALDRLDSRKIADLMNNVVSHVTIWKWASEDFPGLLSSKTKDEDKKGSKPERRKDMLSAAQIEQQAAVNALLQASRLLHSDKVTDPALLNDLACLAKEIMEEAVKRGGAPAKSQFTSPL